MCIRIHSMSNVFSDRGWTLVGGALRLNCEKGNRSDHHIDGLNSLSLHAYKHALAHTCN